MESSDYTYIFSNLSDTPNAVSRLGGNTAANRVSPCKVIIEDSQLLSPPGTPQRLQI